MPVDHGRGSPEVGHGAGASLGGKEPGGRVSRV